tara:strand:+ start:1663 stop:1866 length:204 start_codon:yes stop_codon:yes gene_type:complete
MKKGMSERIKIAALATYIVLSILTGSVFHQELGYGPLLSPVVGFGLGAMLYFFVIRQLFDLFLKSNY